jgi:hypothetical protein
MAGRFKATPDGYVAGMVFELLFSSGSSINPPGIISLKQNKSPFKWRHFEPTIILLCVRWYCRYLIPEADFERFRF